MNLYGYGAGDPINNADPFGLMPGWEFAAIGVTSVVNPTGGAVRGCDAGWGCGHFGASRDGGSRMHAGTDYVGEAGQDAKAVLSGTVRIGRPYAGGTDSETLRLVEITRWDGTTSKQFYTAPADGIRNGSTVVAGQVVGTLQTLQKRYKGITEHSHVEVKKEGTPVNPATVIP